MKIRKFEIIECPRCGAQYLPAEIFYPKEFLGNPKNIYRNSDGRLIDYDGNSMNLSETYCCDNCGNRFKVTAKVHLSVEEIIEDVFDEEYTCQIDASLFMK